ncbi:MAG TPA: ABC transporter ATP-binding protein [Campylobacterales bacterium]|nr:ABC transporter ATP-binding protein [Campylobacterales bacterium]
MIKISNLSKNYGKHQALKSINLEMNAGSIYGLLGPNGAGKTTLISALVGLNSYDSGEIHIQNKNLKEELAYIQSISSLIPQNLAFYPTLTAKDNLEFFAGMLGLKGQALKSRLEYVMNISQLQEVFKKQAQTYSGGLKRRLNIAIGLLSDPEIIYFDEPTVGIDPQSRNFILESIKSMKDDKKLIVYTSHYMEEVEFLCDKIAIIDHGKILKEGTLESLLTDFKALIKTEKQSFEIELDALSKTLDELLTKGEKVKSVEYGHNLENYFLQLTSKELRE